jgi:hypothetical protein
MNYKRIYVELMDRAVGRVEEVGEYYESHHIKPKSMEGTDDKSNLVKLTYREHFIAHWLLHRIFPEDRSLSAAFHIMAFGKSWRAARKTRSTYMPSSRALAEARAAQVSHRKGMKHSEETLEKMRKPRGPIRKPKPPISDETREKMRLAKLGKKRSEEERLAISKGKKEQTPTGKEHHRYGVKLKKSTIKKLKEAWVHRKKDNE